MALGNSNRLPKRFQPYLDQALNEADLRYGAQEATFGTVLGQLSKDRDRQLLAQQTAQQSLLGSLNQSDQNVNRYYSDAGLNPTVLGSLAGSNTGARLAGEMAGYRTQNQQNLLSAQAGGQYQQQRINQDFGDKRQTLLDQLNAEQHERGVFTQSALDQLISGDRSARHEAGLAAKAQQAKDAQNILDAQNAQSNALIGQGLLVDPKTGELQPLPGGNADPNAPKFDDKPGSTKPRTTGPGTAKPAVQQAAATDFGRALSIAQGLTKGEKLTKGLRHKVAGWLLNGAPAIEGKPVYDTREKIKGVANPNYGKPLLNADGTQATTQDGADAIPQIENQPVVQAALDMVFDGHLSADTVRKLHELGYKVRGFSGIKTQADVPKKKVNRPNSNLGVDSNGQMRPT